MAADGTNAVYQCSVAIRRSLQVQYEKRELPGLCIRFLHQGTLDLKRYNLASMMVLSCSDHVLVQMGEGGEPTLTAGRMRNTVRRNVGAHVRAQ